MIAILAVSVVAGGCSRDTSNGEVASSTTSIVATTVAEVAPAEQSFVPPDYESFMTDDGRTRSYRIVDLSGGQPAPLILVLHGFGGTAEAMRTYTGIEDVVASSLDEGAVIVYPNGTGVDSGLPQSWNAGGCCPFSIYEMVDDVAFLGQLIDRTTAAYDIDTERVWVIGHSNGGMMAYRLACELSTRVTAIGVAAGAMMIDSCRPSRAVNALHLHGDLDEVVPLAGGELAGIVFPSAQQSFERFAAANSCVVNDVGADCPSGTTVVLQTNPTWTHDWQPDWTSTFLEFLSRQ